MPYRKEWQENIFHAFHEELLTFFSEICWWVTINFYKSLPILLNIRFYLSHGVAGDDGNNFPAKQANDIIGNSNHIFVPSLRFFLCSEDCKYILEHVESLGSKEIRISIHFEVFWALENDRLGFDPYRKWKWIFLLMKVHYFADSSVGNTPWQSILNV